MQYIVMAQPNRYKLLKLAFENGTIRRLINIQDIVHITVLTKDMQVNYNTLCKRLLDPGTLTVNNIEKMADLMDVEPGAIFQYIMKENRQHDLR